MDNIFLKQAKLQEEYGVGSTYCTKICRIIDSHPEIYSYPRLGTRYNKYAFFHAFAFYKKLKNGEEVPPYDISEIKKIIGDDEVEKVDLEVHKAHVEHCLKARLYDEIKEWFRVTEIPMELSARDYSKIAYKAIISIVTE